jgi:hypothetical protein
MRIDSRIRSSAAGLLLLVAAAAAVAGEEPKNVGAEERVTVARTQVDIIVWPPKDDVTACEPLTKRDFEVRVGRGAFMDFEIDPFLAPPRASVAGSVSEHPTTAERAPRLVALLFDWWGLGGGEPTDGDPRGSAFGQARTYIADNPQDSFVILDIADDARFYSTSFETNRMALATLARFEAEANRTGFLIKGQHLDSRAWENAVTDAVARLGAMEPKATKDLFVLTTDLPVSVNNAGWQQTLKQAASQNKIRIHSLDFAWNLRVLPFGLYAFSEAGGGTVFDHGATLSSAIRTLDKLTPCTFRLTLNVPESKKPLSLSVKIANAKFRVVAPAVVGGRIDTAAAERAELENDLASPNLERGLRITPRMVAIERRETTTEYVLTFLVEKTMEFDPADVGALRVYGMVWQKYARRPTVYSDYAGMLIGEDGLEEIHDAGAKAFRFPGTVRIGNDEGPLSVITSVHGPRDAVPRLAASREIAWNPSQEAARASALKTRRP